ncbi:hypothetical protein COCOBI_03-0680 [Coccomyxa sp. Obi]|nr:hypothetical protein COCOBI_03-0680 [Coccomyxa sp. Obi]
MADLKWYAAYLAAESGAFLHHPWIKKLIDVSNRRLDPHELLKIYREDPGSLKIADLKDPNRFWMPLEAEGTAHLQSMSRCAAMRALVGNLEWKESPKLQALQKQSKSKRVGQPPRYLKVRDEDDLEDFLSYIVGIESEIWSVSPSKKGGSKDVSHQGNADAMEA